ncbi:hypothetical protein [Kitasatospora azatica]|uniref:hypothetical protein n=1 Tax=Kitasatospora azatica TaxID=58347 RepID=UPI0006905BBF|nr:hypothetical protein [Kitasatospora azatica]
MACAGLVAAVLVLLTGCEEQQAARLGGLPVAAVSSASLPPLPLTKGGAQGLRRERGTVQASPSATAEASPGVTPEASLEPGPAPGAEEEPAAPTPVVEPPRPKPSPRRSPEPPPRAPQTAQPPQQQPEPAPAAPGATMGICDAAEHFGQWAPGSEQERLCRSVYGG